MQTDKAVVSAECYYDGLVGKIFMAEGSAGMEVGITPDMMNNMASLSPTMMEGTTVKWYKEEFITNWDLLTRSNTS